MKCTDCKGSGVYVGLGHYNERENCRRCSGNGIEPVGVTGATGTPLRNYQQDALDNQLASRALWTGHAETIYEPTILRLSENQGQFPGRVNLRINPNRTSFTDFKYDNGKGRPVRYNDADTGIYWLMLGRRCDGNSAAHARLRTWDTVQIPRAVIEGYAQDHYLTLYQRIEMKNEFKCLWHY